LGATIVARRSRIFGLSSPSPRPIVCSEELREKRHMSTAPVGVAKPPNDTAYGIASFKKPKGLSRLHTPSKQELYSCACWNITDHLLIRCFSRLKPWVWCLQINCYNAAEPQMTFGGYKTSGWEGEQMISFVVSVPNPKAGSLMRRRFAWIGGPADDRKNSPGARSTVQGDIV